MSKVINCWYCRTAIEDESDIELGKVGNKNFKFHNSTKCYDAYKNKKEKEAETKRINEGIRELEQYIEKEIFNHIPNRKLSYEEVRFLQKIRNGSVVQSDTRISDNGYPYPIILTTFKVKKPEIDRALSTKTFDSDTHIFYYVMAIIINSINDVYYRVLQKEKRDKKIEEQSKNISAPKPVKDIDYIKKSEVNNKNSLFDDIW